MDAITSFHIDFPSGVSVNNQIIRKLAEIPEYNISEAEPLAHSVDPDTLDHLIRNSPDLSTVIFDYDAFTIAVSGNRYVEVWPRAEIPEIQTEMA